MPRVQVGYEPGAEALQTTAAPNLRPVQVDLDPRSSRAYQLAEALGKAQPILDRFNEDYERKKLQDQMMKLDSYKEQFRRDNTDGAVTAAQVRERFPETVPVVAARVAESVGSDDGKKAIQPIIDEIMGNDELRLDSGKRAAYIADRRKELIGEISPDNEFYAAGKIKAIDAELKQWENSWQRQTAEYHQQVQGKAFSEEIVKTLVAGGSLEDVDAKWKSSSSLNNLERNKLVIDTVTKQAFGTDDPSILDKIPTRFLNAETRAQVEHSKLQIQEARMSKLRASQYITNQQREEATRNDKLMMIQDVVSGKEVNPGNFRSNPESFQFAMQMKDAGKLPEAKSMANAQKVRQTILSASTTNGDIDTNKMIDQVLANPALNPKEKQSLINEMPKLVEGYVAMNDDQVKSSLNLRLEARLKALESSSNARVQSLITGKNLRGDVLKSFDTGIRNGFSSYYEDNGRWPTGKAKQDIVDRETDRAEKLLEDLTRIDSMNKQPGATPSTPAATPAPAAKSAPTTTGPAKVTNDAEYNALKSGTLFTGPDGVTRRKP